MSHLVVEMRLNARASPVSFGMKYDPTLAGPVWLTVHGSQCILIVSSILQ